ncbi:uncharacterized protein EKO05_0007463 [Ascochyta rabiei]|uniref:uncharacterized protein n=1 Tax=Didymella rabiei TaxID=5454 RepID=UPI002204BFAD|nr:uncharacterized protein EKO05_0007463 [Ascochyta rabiei]UPX17087.1 hypothetical protein EKO05_0007463 [Ascochyta rabiei]
MTRPHRVCLSGWLMSSLARLRVDVGSADASTFQVQLPPSSSSTPCYASRPCKSFRRTICDRYKSIPNAEHHYEVQFHSNIRHSTQLQLSSYSTQATAASPDRVQQPASL